MPFLVFLKSGLFLTTLRGIEFSIGTNSSRKVMASFENSSSPREQFPGCEIDLDVDLSRDLDKSFTSLRNAGEVTEFKLKVRTTALRRSFDHETLSNDMFYSFSSHYLCRN